MSKRRRFIITSVVLSLGFIAIQFLDQNYRIISIASLGILTILLFSWSLKEGLGWNMTLMSLVLPLYFTVSVGLFGFLLPTNIFTKIPPVIFYGLGLYALCLTSNIYTVSAIRTIALMRAARGVGFVLSLITYFLVYDTILSLKTSIILTSLFVLFFSIPLFLQGFWAVHLEKKLNSQELRHSIFSGLVMAEIALLLFFWPVTVAVGSLFLTTSVYIILGLGQAQLEARLFRETVKEYLLVGFIVLLGMFLATRWGG